MPAARHADREQDWDRKSRRCASIIIWVASIICSGSTLRSSRRSLLRAYLPKHLDDSDVHGPNHYRLHFVMANVVMLVLPTTTVIFWLMILILVTATVMLWLMRLFMMSTISAIGSKIVAR